MLGRSLLRLPIRPGFYRSNTQTCAAVAVPAANIARLATLSSAQHERVTIDCRSNGSITLDIHSSSNPSSSPRILLWLPSGRPWLGSNPASSSDLSPTLLASLGSTTVVQINYRLSSQYRYPTPVHDVLAGYDWVLKHIVPKHARLRTTRHGTRHSINSVRIGICGELIGASLSTMLSLTECHLGTVGVGAAFVNNPIVDWVSMNDTDADSLALDEDAAKSLPNNDPADTRQDRRRRRPFQAPSLSRFAFKPQLPTRGLLSARDQLFSTTSYFDPFASPSLFFRTSGVAPPSIYDIDNSDIEQGATRTPRKAYLKYPPSTSALRLPTFRVETGEQSPLKDQNEEFVNLLKRSHRTSADAVMKQQPEWEGVINDDSPSESGSDLEEGNGNKPAYPEKPSAITSTNSTARAQLVFDDGVGLWADLSPDQKMEKLIEIDLWFKANLP